MSKTAIIFQGGGPTAVINASLAGFLDAAGNQFTRVLGLPFSLENLNKAPLDLTHLTTSGAFAERKILARTPGAALGSSRLPADAKTIKALITLVDNTDTSLLVGIGGNGTMTVLNSVFQALLDQGSKAKVIGIPKTVDNDLPHTYVAPGFASAARNIALAARDISYDVAAMSRFDDVTILETMGRNTGWLAAAAASLNGAGGQGPDIVLCPERPIDPKTLFETIAACHAQKGYVLIVVSELLYTFDGQELGSNDPDVPRDELGRVMFSLGSGMGAWLAKNIAQQLGFQTRVLRPSILGRADSQSVSKTDSDLAWNCGAHACDLAENGTGNGHMITVLQNQDLGQVPLGDVTGTRSLPPHFLDDNYNITDAARAYFRELIGSVEPLLPQIYPLACPQEKQ